MRGRFKLTNSCRITRLCLHHPFWIVFKLHNENVVLLIGSDAMIEQLLVANSSGFHTGSVSHFRVASVEETLVVVGPVDSGVPAFFQLVLVDLASLAVLDVNGEPIRSGGCEAVSKEATVVAKTP